MVLLSARIRTIVPGILCFFAVQSLHSAVVIKGDEYAGSGKTFSFAVNKVALDNMNDVLFVGALDSGAGVFSLSGLHSSIEQAQPLAAPIVSLNNQAQQKNPIYDQGITFLDILEATDGKFMPIMVLNNDPKRVYLVRDFTRYDNMSVFATAPLLDSNNQPTQGIVSLVGYRGQLRSAALAAVTPSTGYGIFGDDGSAFVPITFQQYQQEIKTDGSDQKTVKVIFGFGQFTGSAPFSRSSSVIAITNPVASITNTVTMQWSRLLQRGYVGLQVVGGAAVNDGARSVMITDVSESGVITLRPFAPATAFDNGDNQIIGGLGSSISLSVQFMENMETSTGLSYLIVQGGNGTPDETAGSVYALPIVNASNVYGLITDPTMHGVLASKNSSVYTFYNGRNPSRFVRRRFVQPATTPADTPRSTDPATRVGGGPLPTGSVIQSLRVLHDAVMISVDQAAGYNYECQNGMFISRAIFNGEGVIQAWTPWERMGGVAEPVFRTEVSVDSGNITYFTGSDPSSINTINRTQWGFGSDAGLKNFAAQINSLYATIRGGVQGLIDVPFGTPGLKGISLYIVGGNKSVTLAQAGTQINGQQCPNTGDFSSGSLIFENGTISNITGSPLMLTVQDGALANVGPIVTAAVGVNSVSNQGYLFVGGSHGLAALTTPGGAGWDTSIGLGEYFAGLTNGMAFQMLGDYSFVRNLVVDGNFLYVVTAKKVDRIDLSTAPIFSATTIASAASLVFDPNDTVLDGIFSAKLGILATSKGVFRTSNGNDVSAISYDDNKYWSMLAVPGSVIPPQTFFVSSTTGFANDFARNNGGMFHLLSAYLGASRARVNRFAVADVSSLPISDATVLPVPDGEIEGYNTSFVTFNGFRSTYTCDGALSLHSIGKTLLISPYVRTRSLRTGVPAPLEDGNGTLIGQVLRSSTSGSWLVAGDFGIRLNE